MTHIASLLLFFAMSLPLAAQSPIVPPKPSPVKPTPLVPATATAKSGELVIIDASKAKGDVDFEYDVTTFGAKQASVSGKRLYLVMPRSDDARSYVVVTISWDDKSRERTTITVAGDMAPPKPKPPVDPMAQLKADVAGIAAAVAKLDGRVTALEVPRPPPEPKPPVPPVPSPDVELGELGKLVLVQALKVGRKSEAKELAGSYGETVSAIRAGGVNTPAAAVGMLFKRNSGILGANTQQWAGFFTWADNELTRRNEKGLLTTMPQHADAFEQFGAALRKAGE